jgi:hypothetical protein
MVSMNEAQKRFSQKDFQVAYLQVYTQETLGGLVGVDELAAAFERLVITDSQVRVGVALTDIFSLRQLPYWFEKLSTTDQFIPLAGAEIGIKWAGGPNLPFALVLLAENQQGYQNLCKLLSLGLTEAGIHPLTAVLDLEMLSQYREGLIAISPYYGGPVCAALRSASSGKQSEAKNRALALREVFGAANFFLGAPPIVTPLPPLPAAEGLEGPTDPHSKLNASLNKIAREQKIGLIVTGETRYLEPNQSQDYAALHNRLGRALIEQYTPAQLQLKGDWLYALTAGHPTSGLQLCSPSELVNRYSEAAWPTALENNRKVAARCANFRLDVHASQAQAELAQRCHTELGHRYAQADSTNTSQALPAEVQAQAWLAGELSKIKELGLATLLLAAATVMAEASPSQVLMPRWLGGSLVGYLLGLSERNPVSEAFTSTSYAHLSSQSHLYLETGRGGRERLLAALNTGASEPSEWVSAPVAVLSSETGATPLLHPRLTVLSLPPHKLNERVALQPAQTVSDGQASLAAQVSANNPPTYLNLLEIRQSAALARLQLALDLLNAWRIQHNEAPLEVKQLPLPIPTESIYDLPAEFERSLIKTRLTYFQNDYPAAYYGAALSLAEPAQRLLYAEAARQNEIIILPPQVNQSHADFILVNQQTLRTGLAAVLGYDAARQLLEVRGPHFSDLTDFAHKTTLTVIQITKLVWSGALDEFGPRQSLIAFAEQIVKAGQDYRDWQDRTTNATPFFKLEAKDEQPSLFDLLSAEVPTVVTEAKAPPALELPTETEVSALSVLERLQRQQEVLGFYTNEHPLWSLRLAGGSHESEDLSLNFTPLAELGLNPASEKAWRVAGLIVGLRRLPLTTVEGKGQELTILKLEDWSGRAEAVVPPEVLEVSGLAGLAEGLAIAGLGRTTITMQDSTASTDTPLLILEALTAYSPQINENLAQLFSAVSEDDSFNEDDLEKLRVEALAQAWAELESSPNVEVTVAEQPSDNGVDEWSERLFEAAGVVAAPAAPNSNEAKGAAKTNTATAKSGGVSGAKSNSSRSGNTDSKDKKVAPPLRKRVLIFMPRGLDVEQQDTFMDKVSDLLRQYRGDDPVIMCVPSLNSTTYHRFEMMALSVTYGPDFEQAFHQEFGSSILKTEDY